MNYLKFKYFFPFSKTNLPKRFYYVAIIEPTITSSSRHLLLCR